jgi:TIR domain/Right handed beta helix region
MAHDVSIFVSHSHADNEFTERLVTDLTASGANVWVDMDAIPYDDIVKKINEGLSGRQWLVLVMSPDALSSEYVQMEVNSALHRVMNKWMRGVIPIVARPCDPESIPPTWAILRRYDASQSYAQAFAQLLEALGLSITKGQPRYSANLPMADPRKVLFQNNRDGGQYAGKPGYDPYAHPGSIKIVDPSGQTRYQTIQAAIIEAEPGDYVYILPGQYQEALHVDKPVVLVGQGRKEDVVITNTGSHPTITIEVDNSAGWAYMDDKSREDLNTRWRYNTPAILSNLTIRHCLDSSEYRSPNSENLDEFTRLASAIYIVETYAEIRDCEIWCQDGNGISVIPRSDYANPRVNVSKCHIRRCGRQGVDIDVTCQLAITECEIYENNRNGILSSCAITIKNCKIYDNKENGVLFSLWDSFEPLLESNRINSNDKYGVLFSGCLSKERAHQNLIDNDLNGNGIGDVCFDIDCSAFEEYLKEQAGSYEYGSFARNEEDYGPPDFEP